MSADHPPSGLDLPPPDLRAAAQPRRLRRRLHRARRSTRLRTTHWRHQAQERCRTPRDGHCHPVAEASTSRKPGGTVAEGEDRMTRVRHFCDQAYYPCLDATVGRPYALYVHGNNDTMGAVRCGRWSRSYRPALAAVARAGDGDRYPGREGPGGLLGAGRQPGGEPDAVALGSGWAPDAFMRHA